MTSTARRARKMVPFGGWEMPVQYTGIIEEHRTVRARRGALRHQPHGRVRDRGARGARDRPAAHHQRRIGPRRRPGPVLAPLLSGGRHRGRPDALPPGRRPVHAHGQRVEHRQGLGVGDGSRRRYGTVDERERGDGAHRGAGAEGRGARRAARRHGRDARAVLPFRPRRRRGGARDHLPDRLYGRGRLRALRARGPRRGALGRVDRGGSRRWHPADRPRRARHAQARDEVRALRQ